MENKIKKRRLELGMTQAQLSERSGIAQSSISEIESGRHVPTLEVAIRLAQALERHVEDLFKV